MCKCITNYNTFNNIFRSIAERLDEKKNNSCNNNRYNSFIIYLCYMFLICFDNGLHRAETFKQFNKEISTFLFYTRNRLKEGFRVFKFWYRFKYQEIFLTVCKLLGASKKYCAFFGVITIRYLKFLNLPQSNSYLMEPKCKKYSPSD